MPKAADKTAPPADALPEIQAVVAEAKKGNQAVLPRLAAVLDAHPGIWKHYGDLGAQAEAAWASLIAGPNLLVRESLLRRAEAMRVELAGPSPAPLEDLLVARVVACWLQLSYHDSLEAQTTGTDEPLRLQAFRAKRQELAHRQYLTSIGALATVRKLLPPAITAATASPPTSKLASGAAKSTSNGQNGRQRNTVGREKKYQPHNRIADLLTPTPNGKTRPGPARAAKAAAV